MYHRAYHSEIPRFTHSAYFYVLFDSQTNKKLSPLTDWFYKQEGMCLLCGTAEYLNIIEVIFGI